MGVHNVFKVFNVTNVKAVSMKIKQGFILLLLLTLQTSKRQTLYSKPYFLQNLMSNNNMPVQVGMHGFAAEMIGLPVF